jgi:hypothetical protein
MRRGQVDNSGPATARGGYANSGIHVGDVHQHAEKTVETWYEHQVRCIAPPSLLGREAELAELAEFCILAVDRWPVHMAGA